MRDWSGDKLLATAWGYRESRILMTAAELDVFTMLADAPRSAGDLANTLNLKPRGITILLDALTAMELLTKDGDQYHCPESMASLLSSHAPGTRLPMILHAANQWYKWSDLTGVILGTLEPGRHKSTPSSLRAFIEAMDVVARPLAVRVAEAVNPGDARRFLDVGGGPGTYTVALLEASDELQATLFDRPDVLKIASQRITASGMLERVELVGGDFYTDELPPDHDLALLSAIIHQNSREQNVALYRKVLAALVPGGRLIVRDHVMQPNRVEPTTGALFAVNMLASTEGGNCYTFDEIHEDLVEAGFTRISRILAGEAMDDLIEAYRP